ncbi:protein translocase subunit [Knufia peltigerae]|uniref:Mitochondrial import inner membrane translocase subunit n=1 Tax=Knufia peltigerae TaxID=1002370 RepID=A0AA38YAP9_9EURO|nr:protein translocase subunit [Knufia peltigerae]
MAFGGLFGGSSSSSDSSSSSSSSSSTDQAAFSSPLGQSSPSASGSATLQRIQSAISQQSNVANARYLISKVNENCFEHCVSNPPGSSLSSGENKCLTACMEKYFDAWNVVNRAYVTRVQKEGALMANTTGGSPGGKELF